MGQFDVGAVLEEMLGQFTSAIGDGAGNAAAYGREIFEKQRASLEELAMARLNGDIDDDELAGEIEREKLVVETELITMQIFAKATVQNAVNAAMGVFYKAVQAAVNIVL